MAQYRLSRVSRVQPGVRQSRMLSDRWRSDLHVCLLCSYGLPLRNRCCRGEACGHRRDAHRRWRASTGRLDPGWCHRLPFFRPQSGSAGLRAEPQPARRKRSTVLQVCPRSVHRLLRPESCRPTHLRPVVCLCCTHALCDGLPNRSARNCYDNAFEEQCFLTNDALPQAVCDTDSTLGCVFEPGHTARRDGC